MFDTCDELTAACLKTLRFIICSFSYKSWMFVVNIQLPELETLVYLLERIKKAFANKQCVKQQRLILCFVRINSTFLYHRKPAGTSGLRQVQLLVAQQEGHTLPPVHRKALLLRLRSGRHAGLLHRAA